MENHGYVFLHLGISNGLKCTDLLEMTALHIIHAHSLGGNIKEIDMRIYAIWEIL